MRLALAFALCFQVGCAVDKNDGGDLRPDGGLQLPGSGALDAVIDNELDRDAACAAASEAATSKPVNLYVAYDKSSSMGPLKTSQKWDGARKGLDAFVNDPASAGLRVALNFFPQVLDRASACSSSAYKAPRVPFDALPANAPKLLAAVDAENPDGIGTPIYPALSGALNAANEEATTRPGEAGAVLLVTDGDPQGPAGCSGGVDPESTAAIASIAKNAFDRFGVRTFVVGLPGANPSFANAVAAAGGSGSAILVTNAAEIPALFRDALATVRGRAVPCDYEIPTKVEKGEVAVGLVNVEYTKGGAPPSQTLPQDPTCQAGGWRYDDPVAPKKIVLCPKTCEEIRSDPKALVEVLLGCKTIVR
jgi:hypothetical protein